MNLILIEVTIQNETDGETQVNLCKNLISNYKKLLEYRELPTKLFEELCKINIKKK